MLKNRALWLKSIFVGGIVALAFPFALLMGSYVNAGYGLSVDNNKTLDFVWQDTRGVAHDFSALNSDAVYLMMGFFSCSDVCPIRVHQLQQLSEQLDEQMPNSNVRFFMITLDPFNEPAAVRERYFAGLSERFVSASVDDKTLSRLQSQLGERVRQIGDTKTHAGQLYLFNKDKHLVRLYSQLTQPKGALFNDLTTSTELLRKTL